MAAAELRKIPPPQPRCHYRLCECMLWTVPDTILGTKILLDCAGCGGLKKPADDAALAKYGVVIDHELVTRNGEVTNESKRSHSEGKSANKDSTGQGRTDPGRDDRDDRDGSSLF